MNSWTWPEGTRCAVMFSVNFDAESLDLHSTSEKRLFGRFSYGRYGTRAGFPRLMALLRKHAVPATFFVPAADARRHSGLVRVLLDEGHEVGARGFDLENFSEIGEKELETLARARDTLGDLCGSAPAGFRAPGNRLSVHTLGHLARLGFAYDASFQDDDYPYRFDLGGGRTLVEIPSSFALDDAPVYTGRHSHRRLMQTWRDEFDAMHVEGVLCPLTVHLRGDIGSTRAARIAALDDFLQYVKGKPEVRFMQGRELAVHAVSLGLPLEPDPAAAHLATLRVTPVRAS